MKGKEQEWLGQISGRQGDERNLAIMWGVGPNEIAEIPFKIEHNVETTVIQTEIDPEQWEKLMTLGNNGRTTIEKAMEKLGIRDLLFDENSSIGGDATQAKKVRPTHNNNTKKQYEHDNSFDNQPIKLWGQSGALSSKAKKFI